MSVSIGAIDLMRTTPDVALRCGGRVYPVILPQRPELPAIVVSQVSVVSRFVPLDGIPPGGRLLTVAQLQVDAWASTDADVRDLAGAIRAALSGWRGDMVDGETVQGVRFDTDADRFEPGVNVHRVTSDYDVTFIDREE